MVLPIAPWFQVMPKTMLVPRMPAVEKLTSKYLPTSLVKSHQLLVTLSAQLGIRPFWFDAPFLSTMTVLLKSDAAARVAPWKSSVPSPFSGMTSASLSFQFHSTRVVEKAGSFSWMSPSSMARIWYRPISP